MIPHPATFTTSADDVQDHTSISWRVWEIEELPALSEIRFEISNCTSHVGVALAHHDELKRWAEAHPTQLLCGGPNETFLRPHDSFLRPKKSFIRPNESLLRPNEGFICPHEPLLRPNEPFLRPHDSIFRPHEPFLRPKESLLRPKKSLLRPADQRE